MEGEAQVGHCAQRTGPGGHPGLPGSQLHQLAEEPPVGVWVAQSVKHQTLAQVMISWFMSSSPTSVSTVSAEPTLDLLSPLSVPPLLMRSLSLALSLSLSLSL